MKLVRYGKAGKEKPGVIDHKGRIRDLSDLIEDIDGRALSKKMLGKIAKALRKGDLPLAHGKKRLGPPIARPGNFLAVGLNYADHVAETGLSAPTEPALFNKAPNCIVGPHDDIIRPRDAEKLDWEVELGVVIGTRAYGVSEREALEYVAGYCLAHDVSERDFQIAGGGGWVKGKSAPTFGPLGPWLATADEIPDPQAIDLWLEVNGARMQAGSTRAMIFSVAQLIAYISQFMALEPGDVLITGTPAGVGMGRKPQAFLQPGDHVRLGGTGLGEQFARIVDWDGRKKPS